MAKAKKSLSMLTVRQTGSTARGPKSQLNVLKGLGLGRIGKEKTLEDTQAVRGMIRKVHHLVEAQDENGAPLTAEVIDASRLAAKNDQ